MRKDSIDIMGTKENLEKIKDFAWNIGKFGSTWLEGKWLYIAIAADTDRDSIIKLIDYAQENSCYTNVATANFIKAEYGIVNLDNAENQRQNALQELIAKRRLAREA